MREILFRGKRWESECGKLAPAIWLEGSLYYDPVLKRTFILVYDKHAYIPGLGNMGAFHAHAVTPETVGQYTGLTDKNGRKIFEGDVVKHFNDDRNPEDFDTGVILWNQYACQWERTSSGDTDHYKIGPCCQYEVIDNIHDNPEFLCGGATTYGDKADPV